MGWGGAAGRGVRALGCWGVLRGVGGLGLGVESFEALGVGEAGVVPGIDKRLVVIDLGRAVVKVLAQALVRVVVPLL